MDIEMIESTFNLLTFVMVIHVSQAGDELSDDDIRRKHSKYPTAYSTAWYYGYKMRHNNLDIFSSESN